MHQYVLDVLRGTAFAMLFAPGPKVRKNDCTEGLTALIVDVPADVPREQLLEARSHLMKWRAGLACPNNRLLLAGVIIQH